MGPTVRIRLTFRLQFCRQQYYSTGTPKNAEKKLAEDPRLRELGRTLSDEFAVIRENYRTPKNPIVLCHGLLGFDQLRLAGNYLPGIAYWRGITEALTANGVTVITTAVPASGSIEVRAEALIRTIGESLGGSEINLIGHSMVRIGISLSSEFNPFPVSLLRSSAWAPCYRDLRLFRGIDARYMISKLRPSTFKVLSLITVATPHRGSSFADYMLDFIGKKRLPRIYKAAEAVGMQTGAFSQLTTHYMKEVFNPAIPDDESVRYFSYGAMTEPSLFSVFRHSHNIIKKYEGPNDGLVSVYSAQWGTYKGTLVGPSHLDIINWTNRLKWAISEMTGTKKQFNAIAFYCDIADMLAEEGL